MHVCLCVCILRIATWAKSVKCSRIEFNSVTFVRQVEDRPWRKCLEIWSFSFWFSLPICTSYYINNTYKIRSNIEFKCRNVACAFCSHSLCSLCECVSVVSLGSSRSTNLSSIWFDCARCPQCHTVCHVMSLQSQCRFHTLIWRHTHNKHTHMTRADYPIYFDLFINLLSNRNVCSHRRKYVRDEKFSWAHADCVCSMAFASAHLQVLHSSYLFCHHLLVSGFTVMMCFFLSSLGC